MKRRHLISFFLILFFVLPLGCLDIDYEEFKGLSAGFDLYPNSSLIVFSDYQNNQGSLYVYNYSSDIVEHGIHYSNYSCYNPRFSLDGSNILFIRAKVTDRQNKSIMVCDLKTGNTTRITEKYSKYSECVMSKENDIVYYIEYGYVGSPSIYHRDYPHDFDIFKINITTKEVVQLTDLNSYQMGGLSISADGKTLLFGVNVESKPFKIYNLENDQLTSLKPKGDFYDRIFSDPAFTPDDDRILFSALSGNDKHFLYNIYEMNVTSGEATQLSFEKGHLREPRSIDKDHYICIEDANWPNNPDKNRFYTNDPNMTSIDVNKIRMK